MVTLKTKPLMHNTSSFDNCKNAIGTNDNTFLDNNTSIVTKMTPTNNHTTNNTSLQSFGANATAGITSACSTHNTNKIDSIAPTLTLSLGNGIQFVVIPTVINGNDNNNNGMMNNGTVSFQQDPNNPNEFNLQLVSFTGTMKIIQQSLTNDDPNMSNNKYVVPTEQQLNSSNITPLPNKVNQVTPKNSISPSTTLKISKINTSSKNNNKNADKILTAMKGKHNIPIRPHSFFEKKKNNTKMTTNSQLEVIESNNDNEQRAQLKRLRHALESPELVVVDNNDKNVLQDENNVSHKNMNIDHNHIHHHDDQPSQSLLVFGEESEELQPSLGQPNFTQTQTQLSYATNTIDDDDDDEFHDAINQHHPTSSPSSSSSLLSRHHNDNDIPNFLSTANEDVADISFDHNTNDHDHRPSKIQRILEEGTVGSVEDEVEEQGYNNDVENYEQTDNADEKEEVEDKMVIASVQGEVEEQCNNDVVHFEQPHTNVAKDDEENMIESSVQDNIIISKHPNSFRIAEVSPMKVNDDVDNNNNKKLVKNNNKKKKNTEKICYPESSPVTTIPVTGQDPPVSRWGHTLTSIDNNRIVLYGGQTYDEKTLYPITLTDLYVYDIPKNIWFKPYNSVSNSISRQWHTCTYIPTRNTLIAIGGERIDVKSGKTKTVDQVMTFDTELMLWYSPTTTGDIPTGRSGHTATYLSLSDSSSTTSKMNELIVVFGGVLQGGRKWSNSVSILDTNRWIWNVTPKVIQGSAPKPRSYHSAIALGKNRIIYFGGNDATQCFNTVHILEIVEIEDNKDDLMLTCLSQEEINQNNNKNKKGKNKKNTNEKIKKMDDNSINYGLIWKHPTVSGGTNIPAPRTGHTATLLHDQKTILLYGGWDPKMDDETQGNTLPGDDDKIYDTTYLLNTETWTWSIGPPVNYAVFPSTTIDYTRFRQCQDGGPKRVGHEAILLPPPLLNPADIPTDQQLNNSSNDSQVPHETEGEEPKSSNVTLQSSTDTTGDYDMEGNNMIEHHHTSSNDDQDIKTTPTQMPSASSIYGEVLVFGGRIPGDKFTGDFQIIMMDDK